MPFTCDFLYTAYSDVQSYGVHIFSIDVAMDAGKCDIDGGIDENGGAMVFAILFLNMAFKITLDLNLLFDFF